MQPRGRRTRSFARSQPSGAPLPRLPDSHSRLGRLADVLTGRVRQAARWRGGSEAQLFVGSFALLIALGTLGFQVLPGLYTAQPIGWLDGLFTATSAVCVTGLIVVDTATVFTVWGQAYVLLLIQLGGLGILTFSTLLVSALGRRLSLRQEGIARSVAGPADHIDALRLTRHVLVFTFATEALGALALWVLWAPAQGAAGAVWPAVFHAVSAFCNAGFSTNTDNLIGEAGHPAVLTVVMALIVVGGIGFLVLEELYLAVKSPRGARGYRLSVHTRLVLVTTAVLIVGGTAGFALLEWRATLAGMPLADRIANSAFLSVTARTAGFNAVDYGVITPGAAFLTVLLMSVGGSPGSTAGGLKTTTVALIALLAWARLRGRERVNLWGRSVPEETVQRAVGVFVLAFGLVTASIFLLTATEASDGTDRFLHQMFEASSAFNTVGLSMNHTGSLSTAGRWTIIALMFVGRVGPLTFAAALARRRDTTPIRFAHEDVALG